MNKFQKILVYLEMLFAFMALSSVIDGKNFKEFIAIAVCIAAVERLFFWDTQNTKT